MKLKFVLTSLFAAAAAAASTATFAQSTCCAPAGNDWPEVNGNIGAWQYSSLTQINKSNINKLGPAWVVHVSAEPITAPVAGPGDNSTATQETSPIVVGGVMYLDTNSGGVIALDGETGAVKWKWQPSVAANGFGPGGFHRGVSVGGGRVYTTAAGNRVVALDQNTGAIVWAVQPKASDGSTLGTIAKAHTMYQDGLVIQGTNDSSRGSIFALNANDGSMAWYFFSAYPHGTVFTDVNGNTFDAGDTWTTKVTPNDTPNNCYLTAGATAWQHPTIDPVLGMLYVTFGNVRSCTGAQDGSTRYGTNLFGSSIVALDLKTGAYKWHFQTIRHEHWDQDAVLVPQIADITINGQTRKVIYTGSKAGHQYVLDRTNGKPALAVEDRLVPVDTRTNAWLTQPFPVVGAFIEQCVAYQNLGSDVPGLPNRAVPNWNGYQAEPDPAHAGQLRLVVHEPNYLDPETPFMVGPPRVGCIEEDSLLPWLSMSSSNGTADMSVPAYSPLLNLRYILYNYSPAAHPIAQGGNSLRQIGGYQTGGITALNASTMQVVWKKQLALDASRQNNPVVTATGLLFFTQMDGWLTAMDAATGDVLWRFQTGFPSQSGTITYMINGEQYIAMAAMAGNQPYSQTPNGDAVWVFKLGGKALYTTGPQSDPVVVSGSQEAPSPPPINKRRPVDNTAAGIVPPTEIWMARSNGNANSAADSTNTSSMVPSRLTVPLGTTVTFRNPGVETFTTTPNLKEHCATQFFEGKFNFRLQPGQTAQYTFDREGEYFYNDCTDPRPSGKVIVTLAAENAAMKIEPQVLNFKGANGLFTGVNGTMQAMITVPAGWTLDKGPVGDPSTGPVIMVTPLTTQTFNAVSTAADGGVLVATFNRADIDNNVPSGDAVPLTVTANFLDSNGVQRKLQGTATVKVMK
jgi:outer membrane protein assembly factor BamB